MDITYLVFAVASLIMIFIILYQQKLFSSKLGDQSLQNAQFLESIEKYVEIFNEQNINALIEKNDSLDHSIASEKINSIRQEYRKKLLSKNKTLTEEHEMLIDFVTLSLSLLIKTPPNLRERIINENTDNSMIQKILISKLNSIENYYLPVSLLEIAISQNEK